ncbi:MAG: sodium:proton antiporter [bacterium]
MHAENLGLTLPLWSVIPFVGILLTIALLPLWKPHWWESNANKSWVSFLWAAPVFIFFVLKGRQDLTHTMQEYISFIVLLGALFIVSGGIVLRGDLKATPMVNTSFLLIGSILANFIGTTGASMLLIRPLIKTNQERKHIHHIPIFFIFLVSNIGGCLTPLGDPPLFMGFLKGVPFFWTLKLFPEWLTTLTIILIIFYLMDRHYYKREAPIDLRHDLEQIEPLSLKGKINFLWIGGVICGVLLHSPYREIVLVAMSIMSLITTKKEYRKENVFTFNPIIEVAVLFLGIFITMIPTLLILNARGAQFGINQPWQFFWLTGSLSSFLDNTPTYLTFFSLSQGLGLNGEMLGIPTDFLKAISLGAVFMGANSYIGNGPNFMVKAIVEENKIKMPSFFGYMFYAAVILIPIFIIITLIYL